MADSGKRARMRTSERVGYTSDPDSRRCCRRAGTGARQRSRRPVFCRCCFTRTSSQAAFLREHNGWIVIDEGSSNAPSVWAGWGYRGSAATAVAQNEEQQQTVLHFDGPVDWSTIEPGTDVLLLAGAAATQPRDTQLYQ